jgi:hypothetical protein
MLGKGEFELKPYLITLWRERILQLDHANGLSNLTPHSTILEKTTIGPIINRSVQFQNMNISILA